MKKQTYILQVWSGAPTYIEAARQHNGSMNYMFFRMACKLHTTVLKKLRNAVIEDKERGLYCEYFHADDARYEIISTPNGYDKERVVSSGLIADIIK